MRKTKSGFRGYAFLTDSQKLAIQDAYQEYMRVTPDPEHVDVGHAVACAANTGLKLTGREWNGEQGGEAFAAALTFLVMSGAIKLSDTGKLK